MAKKKSKEKTKIDFSVVTDRVKYLKDLAAKEYGEGALTQGEWKAADCEAISTGALNLDLATGIGGIPRGRITEIFGPEGSGKTTLMLHVIASAQKEGGVAAFIDAEHALDPGYAKKIGVDIDNLLISQPDCGEQALDIVELICDTNAADVIVVDSVAALVPRAELEGNMGDHHVGLQARLMSQALRKLTSKASKSDTAIVFINQLREKIGVMFGSPETTTGGKALKFYSSMRLDIRRRATLKDGDGASGSLVRVKVVKNKVAQPFKEAEFEIIFGKGVNRAGCVLDIAVEHKLIIKNGNFYKINNISLNGKTQASSYLADNEPLLAELEIELLEKLQGPVEDNTEESNGTNPTV